MRGVRRGARVRNRREGGGDFEGRGKWHREAGETRDIGSKMQGGERMSLEGERGRSASRMLASLWHDGSTIREKSDGRDRSTRHHDRMIRGLPAKFLASMSLFED